jgi:hypothetical protein
MATVETHFKIKILLKHFKNYDYPEWQSTFLLSSSLFYFPRALLSVQIDQIPANQRTKTKQ